MAEGMVASRATPSLAGVRAYLAQRLELVGLGVLLVATVLLPKSTPLGIYLLGASAGASLALHTLGIVLVYRANRVINFAQVEIGALGGLLFVEMARRGTLLVGLHYACPSCVRVVPVTVNARTFSVPLRPAHWLVLANYWLSMVLAIALVVVLAYAVHALIIKRFMAAPRLILTLITIGLAQTFVLCQGIILRVFATPSGIGSSNAPFPFKLGLRISPVNFGTTDIVTVIVVTAAVVALVLFLRRSAVGVMLRGSADNPARAQTLGVDVRSVTSVAWLIAALLSAVASILGATNLGVAGVGASAMLVRILAAAVIAGMASLPIAIGAALVIGMLAQAVLWSLNAPALVDGFLVVVIVAVLLLQRSRATRADTAAEGGWRATREARPIPTELRELDVVRRWVRNGQVLLIVVGLGLPWVLSPGQTAQATTAFLFGILGLSLLVLTGWAGQISLGQFGFAAVGAWVVALTGWPFPIAILAGALAGAAAAVIVGLPALRLRGLHLAITTLAFSVAVSAVLLNGQYLGKHMRTSLHRPLLLGLNLDDERSFYYFVLVFLLLTIGATVGMRRSRTARALIACRDNEPLAQAYGIDLVRLRLSAFAISGFMAAVAGALFAYAQFGVHTQNFGVTQSINIFLIAVIGGLGSLAGPLIGAGYYGVVNVFSDNPLVALGATGIGVVLILLMLPGGLGDGAYRIRDALLRRVADRYRIHVPSLIADGKARDDDRAGIAPKLYPGGGKVLIPSRYRLDDQWALEARHKAAIGG